MGHDFVAAPVWSRPRELGESIEQDADVGENLQISTGPLS